MGAGYGRAPFERTAMPVASLLVSAIALLVIVALRPFRRRLPAPAAALAGALIAPVLLLPVLHRYRESHRDLLVAQGMVLHDMPRYWMPAASLVDTPRQPRRIAVTSGPNQHMDAWFVYYFMGRSLQNRLEYVPITRDGGLVDFDIQLSLRWCGDPDAWIARVRAAGITEVMSFPPVSAELRWMQQRPALFERLAGDGETWGLFRVRRNG
jgi:hypothetical protein